MSGRDILSDLLNGIPEKHGNWKPGPDRWSAAEIAAHLRDIEEEDFRRDLDIILHHPGRAWPSFDEIAWVTERRYNERVLAGEVRAFLDAREATLAWLEDLGDPNPAMAFRGEGNPRCFDGDPARIGDLLVSWIAHDLFHIRQLALLRFDILNRRDDGFSPLYSGFAV